MKQEYKCVGGPMDGRTVTVDRDEITYLPTTPVSTSDHTVATYTMRRDPDTREWFLEWDGDIRVDA